MKKINESKFELMRVPEIKELFHNFNDAVKGCEFLQTAMPEQVAKWTSSYNAFLWAYETSLKADETDEIHALDFQTDNQLTGVKAAANGASKSFDPEMSAAGLSVLQAFTSFPVKLNDNYIAELGQVDTLLAVLLGQELENVTKIGALPLVNLIKQANDRMHELIGERDMEYPLRPNRPEARKNAIEAYLAFTEYINSYRLVVVGSDENVSLDLFIDLVNSIIARFERVVLRESSKPAPSEPPTEQNPGGGEGAPENPNPNPETPNPNPENPGNGEGGENNGSNNGENNGENGENNTNTPDPDDPWYNPDDEPD